MCEIPASNGFLDLFSFKANNTHIFTVYICIPRTTLLSFLQGGQFKELKVKIEGFVFYK